MKNLNILYLYHVLYIDDDLIAIDKSAGIAVQGGSRVINHVDGLT